MPSAPLVRRELLDQARHRVGAGHPGEPGRRLGRRGFAAGEEFLPLGGQRGLGVVGVVVGVVGQAQEGAVEHGQGGALAREGAVTPLADGRPAPELRRPPREAPPEEVGPPGDDLTARLLARHVLQIPDLARTEPDARRTLDVVLGLLGRGWPACLTETG
ncbi:hypothetical protein [Streptomyces antibioticus]|uniref:hypothetical protein n=1 Tax=Streptomyces antibioticus TaxID=1890 RepID=UPI003D754631